MYPQYSTLIFDIGDVLFSWSSDTKTNISSKTLRQILSSTTWFDYECGRLSEDDCYERVGAEFSVHPEEVRDAFCQARESLKPDDEMLNLIHELKSLSNGRLRVYAMSNISLPDYQVLRTKSANWSVFDVVFTSGEAGVRKPDLGFYQYVLAKTRIDPRTAVFVDDKLENVLTARSFGLKGVVFDDRRKAMRALRNLSGNPIKRGQDYLNEYAGRLHSITDSGVTLHENFAQLLILEATNNPELVDLMDCPREWNFFQGGGELTTADFPYDLDTTSLGLTIMKRDESTATSVMNKMLQHITSDGLVQTYFDHRRPRIDPVVCVNVLALFYTYGRGAELQRTLEWVRNVLLNRAYLDGTRYYATPECFLYFLGRLLDRSAATELHSSLRHLLKERVLERIGADGDALALAMRILTCTSLGIKDEIDLRQLLPLQCEDGGWEMGWIYKYGSSGVKIGNRGLVTALAIKAIETLPHSSLTPHIPTRPGRLTADETDATDRRRNSLVWFGGGGRIKSREVVFLINLVITGFMSVLLGIVGSSMKH